jgi:putative glutamine amidotransferase
MIDRIRAPLIGLPARIDEGGDREYVIRDYSEAVRASGAVPIIIPLLEDPGVFRPLLTILDGILLTGANSDVDPAKYGAARHEKCGPVQELHDRMDFFLIENAMKQKLPILAICFGTQSLNVFLGGTLIQDVPAETRTPVRHRVPESDGKQSHAIRVEAGSLLEQLSGAPEAQVNSTHHQAIDVPGRGLRVLARCTDGVVESVGLLDDEQWILGVQWHPEKSFSYDKFSRNIFNAFVAECRARRQSPAGPCPSDALQSWGGPVARRLAGHP